MSEEIDRHPYEPDDKGGGFPGLTVMAEINNEKDLDKLIKKLLNNREWLRKQIAKCEG